jgi:putative ABC transport system permease protein
MNVLKRAFVASSRNWRKSATLFLLLLILSSFSAGAISIHQAILNTDRNLRQRMPAIVMIAHQLSSKQAEEVYAQTGEWPEFEFLTLEMIRQIGQLPQVRAFDYSIDMSWGVTGRDLSLWDNPNTDFLPLVGAYDEALGIRLYIRGVNATDFLEIRDNFAVLTEGRTFNDVEINVLGDVNPAIITSGFAQANQLRIGSIFEAQVVIFEERKLEAVSELEVYLEESFPLEIVGIIEPITQQLSEEADFDMLFQNHVQQFLQQHRIYVPNVVAEAMFNVRAEGHSEPTEVVFHNFFVLNDPTDVTSFTAEVDRFPGFWEVVDLSSGFSEITASMENMREIADSILLGSVVASVLIISLLIALYLRDRKHEIGVYLALGEHKKKIMFQLLMEVIPIGLIAMTLALVAGNRLASELSREMLRQDMIYQVQNQSSNQAFHPIEELGYRFELSPEEMLEAYDISLDLNTILTFYVVGIGVTLFATITPIIKSILVPSVKTLFLS